ncbi:MAG TPA: tetratricopeptide repeat protein [Streptosporangiaceae bacterium]
MNLRLQSTTLALSGSPQRGVHVGERALAISSRLGVVAYELAALHSLAFACTLAGQHRRALDLCSRQIVLSKDIGDKRREAQARGVLGDAYRGLGELEKAVDSWLSALPLFRSQHAYRHAALCLQRLAGAYEEMTRYPEALASLEESLLIFQRLRLPGKVGQVQDALARCRMAEESRPSVC